MSTIRKDDPRYSLRGVRRHGNGWQVYRMVNGEMHRRLLPLETRAGDLLKAWEALKANVPVTVAGSFAALVDEYLSRVTSKASYKGRAYGLAQWVAALGAARDPLTVTGTEIDRVVQRWKVTPIKRDRDNGERGRNCPHGLADGTILLRIGHLVSFYNVMFPDAKNPCDKCTTRPSDPKPETRGVAMAVIARILAAMPDTKPDRRSPSLSKIRAAVTAYTGMDPVQIMALQPGDVGLDVDAPWFRAGRHKGDGVEVRTIPATEAGRQALLAFVDAAAWGAYKPSGVNHAVKRAAAKVGVRWGTFRQKDLRHSFLTELFRVCKDTATVARFAGHCEGSPLTLRYTRAAHEEVDRSAAARFTVPMPVPTRTPLQIVRSRKRRAS
jgi:integrase